MKLVVHVDGGARGNPGPAAIAAVLSTPDGDVARGGPRGDRRRDEQRRRVPGAAARTGAGRGRSAPTRSRWSATPSSWPSRSRALQGQAPRDAPAARGGPRARCAVFGAWTIRTVPRAAERARRRARQSGARRRDSDFMWSSDRTFSLHRSRPIRQYGSRSPASLWTGGRRPFFLPRRGDRLPAPARSRQAQLVEALGRGLERHEIGDELVERACRASRAPAAAGRVRRGSR